MTDTNGVSEKNVIALDAGVDRLRVGLIGLGGVAEPHLMAYQALPSIEIVGVAEPRRDRLDEITRRYGVHGYTSCELLIADARPDVACILTPAATHRRLTEQCARAGVHVLCEKPIAVSLEDALAMEKICTRHHVQLFYGSSYRYLPAVQRARSLIRDGVIGEIRLITESLLGGLGAHEYRPMSSQHYPEGGPGGGGHGLVDHGIHMLDIFPWLCGAPVLAALGRGDRTGARPRSEYALLSLQGAATGILMYDGSTRATDLPWEGVFNQGREWIDSRGWVGASGQWEQGAGSIKVYGTEGSLRIFHYANRLFINRSGRMEELPVATGTTPHHFGRQLQQFHEDLRHTRTPATSVHDGIRALRVLHAIYDSERTGSWQDVPVAL